MKILKIKLQTCVVFCSNLMQIFSILDFFKQNWKKREILILRNVNKEEKNYLKEMKKWSKNNKIIKSSCKEIVKKKIISSIRW